MLQVLAMVLFVRFQEALKGFERSWYKVGSIALIPASYSVYRDDFALTASI